MPTRSLCYKVTAISQNSVSQVLSTCVRVTERLFKVPVPGPHRRLTESETPVVNLCSEARFRLLSPICICDLPPPLQRPGPRLAAPALPHSGLASPQRVFVITLTSPPPPTFWKSVFHLRWLFLNRRKVINIVHSPPWLMASRLSPLLWKPPRLFRNFIPFRDAEIRTPPAPSSSTQNRQ